MSIQSIFDRSLREEQRIASRSSTQYSTNFQSIARSILKELSDQLQSQDQYSRNFLITKTRATCREAATNNQEIFDQLLRQEQCVAKLHNNTQGTFVV